MVFPQVQKIFHMKQKSDFFIYIKKQYFLLFKFYRKSLIENCRVIFFIFFKPFEEISYNLERMTRL